MTDASVIQITYPDELQQIRDKHSKRGYTQLADCLRRFLINRSARIRRFREELEQIEKRQLPLESAIGLYILDNKTSVSMNLDMHDQWEEILKHEWIEREKGNPLPVEEIRKQWVKKYAEAWRIHRVREIMYVFSQNKEAYMEMVR